MESLFFDATLVQLNIFKQRSQCRCHFLCLREFYGFFLDLLSCNVIEGFHGETEFASLMAMTFTLTLSPTARTADGCLIRLAQIWEMWTRPERPFPRLMNAPYGCRLSTVPSVTRPTSTLEIFSLRSSSAFSRRFRGRRESDGLFLCQGQKPEPECLCLSIRSDLPHSSGKAWMPG